MELRHLKTDHLLEKGYKVRLVRQDNVLRFQNQGWIKEGQKCNADSVLMYKIPEKEEEPLSKPKPKGGEKKNEKK